MAFCGAKAKVSVMQGGTIQTHLEGISAIWPGTKIACVISESGEIVEKYSATAVDFDEVGAVVGALKQAAVGLSEVSGALYCPVLHISGVNHIFSCYDLGNGGHVSSYHHWSPPPPSVRVLSVHINYFGLHSRFPGASILFGDAPDVSRAFRHDRGR